MSNKEQPDPRAKTYRIDDLAHAAGTTVRNVRAYQEKKLLPPPQRQGRTSIYTSVHLARLRLIMTLLDRGFTLSSIGELLDAWQRGEDLADVLGLEQALTDPFTDERPQPVTVDELHELFGLESALHLERAIEVGMFAMHEGQLSVPNPTLLWAGAELAKMGVPIEALLDEMEQLRGHTDAIAESFVDLANDHIFERYVDNKPPHQAGQLAQDAWRLREIAVKVTQVELGRALQQQIHERIGVLVDRVAHKYKGSS